MRSDELAWLQSTCPDEKYRNGKEAFANASKAYKLGKTYKLSSSKISNYVESVAAAYAESGDFKHAVEWQTKAIDLLSEGDKQKSDYQSRLELYQQKKPFHQEPKAP